MPDSRKIIGFLGNKQSGKDTSGEYIINNYGYRRYAFGDPVKEICRILFCLSDEQLTNGDKKEQIDLRWGLSPRQMFQRLGTEFGQFGIFKLFPELKDKIKYRELWIKLFKEWTNKHNDNIVITDVRFKHEIECIQKIGGIIIRINRDIGIEDSHISENELYNISDELVDFTIDNSYSKEDLYSQIDTIINLPF